MNTLAKFEELKDILEKNAIIKKIQLLKKWEDSTNATLQIALYKLLANEEERKILTSVGRDNDGQE